MIKKNKWKLLISSIAILLPIVFGLIVWNKLPEQIATHWVANGMIYATAFGKTIDMNFIVYLLSGLLFVMIGNYLPKCKQNYTIGIRVKWALENEENWNATHRFSGKVWVIGGVLMMGCTFFPEEISLYVFMALCVVLSTLSEGYSYYYFKTKQGR